MFFDPRGGTHFEGGWKAREGGGPEPVPDPVWVLDGGGEEEGDDARRGGSGEKDGRGPRRKDGEMLEKLGENIVAAVAQERALTGLIQEGDVATLSQQGDVAAMTHKGDVAALSRQGAVAALIQENRRSGVEPDAWTPGARWKREADIPDRVYFQALEALQDTGR